MLEQKVYYRNVLEIDLLLKGGINDAFVVYVLLLGGFLADVLVIILILAVLIAYLFAINEMIKVAKVKGFYKRNTAVLWFIALFTTPLFAILAIGFIIASLPDRAGTEEEATPPEPELPAV